MTRRILALAAFASLLPFPALADDLGAQDDIVVEPERPAQQERVKESVVMDQKPVSLPPPGWRPPQPADDSRDR